MSAECSFLSSKMSDEEVEGNNQVDPIEATHATVVDGAVLFGSNVSPREGEGKPVLSVQAQHVFLFLQKTFREGSQAML